MIERDIKKLLTIWGLLIQFLESLRGKKKVYYFSDICEANSQEMEVPSEYQESEIKKKKKKSTQIHPLLFLHCLHSFTFRKGSIQVSWKARNELNEL